MHQRLELLTAMTMGELADAVASKSKGQQAILDAKGLEAALARRTAEHNDAAHRIS